MCMYVYIYIYIYVVSLLLLHVITRSNKLIINEQYNSINNNITVHIINHNNHSNSNNHNSITRAGCAYKSHSYCYCAIHLIYYQ